MHGSTSHEDQEKKKKRMFGSGILLISMLTLKHCLF
jgi:hypothetical protein